MLNFRREIGTSLLALALVLSGCAKKGTEAEQQLADTKKQLDEANKKLEGAGMQPVPNTPAPASANPGANGSGEKGSAPGANPGATPTDASKPGNWSDIRQGPITHTLTAGTAIVIRTNGTLSTKTATTGAPFQASLHQSLDVDGYTVAPRGSTVEGLILNSDPGGRVKGVASITLGLKRIILADGSSLVISTTTRGAVAPHTKKKDAMKVGIASGIGAAIGAIAGGGRGAAIGAGAGAAGGTGVVLATKGDPAVIPAESLLTFKLAVPVNVQETKK